MPTGKFPVVKHVRDKPGPERIQRPHIQLLIPARDPVAVILQLRQQHDMRVCMASVLGISRFEHKFLFVTEMTLEVTIQQFQLAGELLPDCIVALGIPDQFLVKRGEVVECFHQHPVLYIDLLHTQNPFLTPLEKVFHRSRPRRY